MHVNNNRMEKWWPFSYYCLLLFLSLFFLYKLLLQTKSSSPNLPPTPPSLPILGHIHLLKKPLHRTLAHLSSIYGPVFFLRLGSRPTLIVSSPSIAEECFTKNDVVFANRPRLLVNVLLGYNSTALGAAPHGPLWRNLRRLASDEIFSIARTHEFSAIRHDEAKSMLRKLVRNAGEGSRAVELRTTFRELSFNVMMRMLLGKSYHGDEVEGVEEVKRVREMIRELFVVGDAACFGDAFPYLRWIDLGGWEKRMMILHREMDGFMQGIIEEHRRRMEDGGGTSKTLIDVMLSMQKQDPGFYTDVIIKGVISVIIQEANLFIYLPHQHTPLATNLKVGRKLTTHGRSLRNSKHSKY